MNPVLFASTLIHDEIWILPWYYCLFWKIVSYVPDNTSLSYHMYYIFLPNNTQYHSVHYLCLLVSQYDWSIYDLVVNLCIHIHCFIWYCLEPMHAFTFMVIIGWDPITLVYYINVPTLNIDPDREYSIWLTASDIFLTMLSI